jgi:alpha-tubulin suppressor-like RCC1 family protein
MCRGVVSYPAACARIAAAALCAVLAACPDRVTFPPLGPLLSKVSGDGQVLGVPGGAFAPFVVQAMDSTGGPSVGRPLLFTVSHGGGRFAGRTLLIVVTDSAGRAAATLTADTASLDTSVVVVRLQGTTNPSLTFLTVTAAPVGASTLSVGLAHACAVAASGAAYCWGNNYVGQLGTGDTASSRVPAPVAGAHAFRSISAGESHTCGVATDGATWCWGSNASGQLGVAGVAQTATPVRVTGAPSLRAVAAGGNHSCGVATDGSAWCWGLNASGQLGNGSQSSSQVPVRVSSSATFERLGAGYVHTCGIAADGAILCWGNGTSGQLGNGNANSWAAYPTAVLGGRVYRALGVGRFHGCGVTTIGEAFCWGGNPYGAVGDGSNQNVRSVPAPVAGGLVFTAVALGDGNTCGITAPSGAAYCWGYSGSGQLGNGTRSERDVPTAVVGGLAFRSVQPGSWVTCGITTGGTAYCWGTTMFLGTGRSDVSAIPVAVSGLVAPMLLGVGGAHTCATAPGSLVCWGANVWGQLADGSTDDRFTPSAAAAGLSVVALATGLGDHGCALNGAGAAFCWGQNFSGQLGDGTTSLTANPTVRAVVGGIAFRGIATGFMHTCALTAAGAAYCWGRNSGGELGDSTRTAASTPQPVHGGMAFTVVGAGSGRTCAVTTGHQAACWGTDSLGTIPNSTTPLLIGGGLLFDSLAVGFSHACGLTAGGAAHCWGANTAGQLGTGSVGAPSQVPVAVGGGLTFKSLAAGAWHSCGLTAAGAAYCWGSGTSGQLGAGTAASAYAPVAVSGGLTFTRLVAGMQHTCGAAASGGVYCWGSRGGGRLGDGYADYAPLPQEVAGGLLFAPPAAR